MTEEPPSCILMRFCWKWKPVTPHSLTHLLLAHLNFFSFNSPLTPPAGRTQLQRYQGHAENLTACEASSASHRDDVCPAAVQTGCCMQTTPWDNTLLYKEGRQKKNPKKTACKEAGGLLGQREEKTAVRLMMQRWSDDLIRSFSSVLESSNPAQEVELCAE